MEPPWLKYPDIPLGSIGWRMGEGEEYWHSFVDWYAMLNTAKQAEYRLRYPKPDSWKSFWPYIPEKLESYCNKGR